MRAAQGMKDLGIPELKALTYAALHFRAFPDVNPAMAQAQLVAEGVIWNGTRAVPLKEFMGVTGLPQTAARAAADAAAERLKYAPLPGEILPGRLYPPVGF